MIKILLLYTLLVSNYSHILASASKSEDSEKTIDVWTMTKETGLFIFARETLTIPTTARKETTMVVKDLTTGKFTNMRWQATRTPTTISGTGHIINPTSDSTIDELKTAIAQFEATLAHKS